MIYAVFQDRTAAAKIYWHSSCSVLASKQRVMTCFHDMLSCADSDRVTKKGQLQMWGYVTVEKHRPALISWAGANMVNNCRKGN